MGDISREAELKKNTQTYGAIQTAIEKDWDTFSNTNTVADDLSLQ